MKIITKVLAGSALSACMVLSGEAMAACPGTPLNPGALSSTLTNNTVCATRNGERWQELHQSNGDLVDYKMGPGHPVDPSEKVGTWSIDSPTRAVVYNYNPTDIYRYTVSANGGTSYSFCGIGGAPNIDVTIKSGGGACP